MTSIPADNDDYLDLGFFRFDEPALISLASLDALWQGALEEMAANGRDDPAFAEFVTALAGLVGNLGNPAWQHGWLRAWQHTHGRGVPMTEMMVFLAQLVEACERRLFGQDGQVGRLALDLFSLLRRAVFAAVSGAVDLEEEAQSLSAAIPDELAALRFLREQSDAEGEIAVLSLSLANRSRFGHLSVSDLQGLPGILLERLRQILRPQDRVFSGREGEWLLLLPGIRSLASPTLACAQVEQAFLEPVGLLSGFRLALEPRIGAAMQPSHGRDAEEVVHAARLARWSLPATGARFGWFRPELREQWLRRTELAEELGRAVHQEALAFHLQPQIDAANGCCIGAELLLRWQRVGGDWISPQLLIELVEDNGWRQLLTDALIRFALQAVNQLNAAGISISLSLNLTAADLLDADLPELFAQRLDTWRLPGSRFTIELTESALLGDPERCLDVMHRLKALGMRLALDDFGTGYSSLSYLANLPVDEIKIDHSFIAAMTTGEEHLRVVRTIIDLARDLQKMPLAEGVETSEQVELLRNLGCDCMQGFLYAHAMPLQEFIVWYRARRY